MSSSEIRKKFLKFFEGKGHKIIPSASLIPSETDPTVLFTTAGMQPLVPYLMGLMDHPAGKRVANVQKCVRTGDIEEVGDATHLTFFEMLGNWSFGDYFKREAIEWSWEFLTFPEWLALDKRRLAVSIFKGDEDAPFDKDAFEIWRSLGVPEKRIAKLGKEDNWWGPAGESGPCGPDTEMFYWTGEEEPPAEFDPDDKRWVEVWNDVFMEYYKNADGKYEPLAQKNVDTGMGLERIAMVMQGKDNVYETDLFAPIMDKINELAKEDDIKSKRIIADHIKASVFIISDGVAPSNIGRGYVLRRLIRGAVRRGKLLGIDCGIAEIARVVIDLYKDVYPEIEENKEKVFEELEKEEKKFRKTLERGLKVLNTKRQASIRRRGENDYKVISEKYPLEKFSPYRWTGEHMFNFYQTYGFPFELLVEELLLRGEIKNENIPSLREEFNKEMRRHQELSRTAAAGMFKGGLADAGEETKKLHTATHLLHAALRKVLGNHVVQKGSNITPERLRFDFSHPEKLTDEEIKQVEDLVNQKIKENLPVVCEEMALEEAKKEGAIGVFGQKYGEKVKVYSIGNFSKEICGGPHVKSTGELGNFRIKKEESAAAGIRRIKAVLE